MEKISVIVAVYNIEKYLEECLTSLQNQTYSNYEILVVNDGSTDNSEKIIKSFLKNKKFKYLKKENGGLSSARNFGLEHATGKYIAFIDGDDYIEATYLEKLYNTLSDEYVDISICAFERNYSNKTNYNSVRAGDVMTFRYPAAWNKLYKKSLIDKYKLRFPVSLWYEDLSFTTKALLVGNFSITNDYLYHYRQNDSSITHTYDDRIFQIYPIVEDVVKFAKKEKLYEKFFTELEFMHIYHILVGTIYRISFHKKFSIKNIKEIYDYVFLKYPKWYKNEYIKDLPFYFKVYLKALKYHLNIIIFIMLKLFNNKIHL